MRQFLAMAFFVFIGRYLFHSVRGWLRRRQCALNQIDSDATPTEATVADATTTDGAGQAEVEHG
jgi:hypothetical protein